MSKSQPRFQGKSPGNEVGRNYKTRIKSNQNRGSFDEYNKIKFITA